MAVDYISTGPRPLKTIDILRLLWSTVLGEDIDDIQETDSFFDLGGDSVTSAELVSLVEQQKMGLRMEDIFRFPTLETMAEVVTLKVGATDTKIEPMSLLALNQSPNGVGVQDVQNDLASKCRVLPSDIEDIYPSTPLQESMMAASQLGGKGYMTQLVYEIGLHIDLERFKQAWVMILESNPMMRTRIVKEGNLGSLQCVIRSPVHWKQAQSLDSYLESDAGLPMQEGDELIRLTIIHESDERNSRFFILTIHHAIFDAASLVMVLSDVAAVYDQINISIRPDFSRYVQYIQNADTDITETYWTKALKDANPSPFPNIPDRFGPTMASETLTEDFDFSWTAPMGLTKSLLIRAAWAILMGLQSHNSDVIFALTQNGRSASVTGVNDIPGPTISVLPMRMKLGYDESIKSFLSQVQEQATEMIPFEYYGSLNIRRNLGKDGLRACEYQNLLLVQSDTDDKFERSLDKLGLVQQNSGLPLIYDFPLVNECTYFKDGYRLELRFDSRVLPKTWIQVLASQFDSILRSLCFGDLEMPLNSIRPFTKEDYTQISLWSDSITEPVEETAHSMFHNQALVTPLAQAVCAWDGSLTFAELDSYSTKMANKLLSLGVKCEELVPICMDKSKWAVVAILSVLKAGAAWIPLDPKHPRNRHLEVIEMSKARLILTTPRLVHQMSNLRSDNQLQVVAPEDYLIASNISRDEPLQARNDVNCHNTAYVLFTSGSTGKPKGVVISHLALCNGIREQGKPLSCNSSWRSLQFSAHTFDPSISETLMTLCHGGCVCVPSEEQRLNDLTGAIKDLQVNCVQLTPSMAHTMLPEDIPSVKTMIFVGEAATPEIISRWAPHVRLMNAYGPTETCIYCSVNQDLSADTNPMDIGNACGGNNWIVDADDHERLAAVGHVGEIVVSGYSLGKGYLENPTATAAAFVTCSWLKIMSPQTKSDRLYRTGDLGYYNTDGSIHLIGRKDNQVKLRGNRIELGEIENRVLNMLPDSTVLALIPKKGPCKQHIVLMVCFTDVNLPSEKETGLQLVSNFSTKKVQSLLSEIRQRLAEEVPHYMIPSYWLVIERFPLNSSGKLDRKTVHEWLSSMKESIYELVANKDDLEADAIPDSSYDANSKTSTVIREAWSNVLKIDSQSLRSDTSFFFLGGDSLSAIKIVAECRNKGVIFSIQDIFRRRTLGSLCHLIENMSNAGIEIFKTIDPKAPFSLSPFQKSLISTQKDIGNISRDVQSYVLELNLDVPQKVLKSAFDQLISNHPMLRARLSQSFDSQRIVAVDDSYRLRFSQYGRLNHQDCERISQEAHQSINLVDGPVFSVDVYRTNECSCILLVGHSMIADSTSWKTIISELGTTISSRTSISPPATNYQSWIAPNILGSQLQSYPDSLEDATAAYWNLQNTSNAIESLSTSWTLEHSHTDRILGTANNAFRTETIDLLLATVAQSFTHVFPDKTKLAIDVGYDARLATSDGIEYLGVVGQFSKIGHILISTEPEGLPEAIIQQVKRTLRRTFREKSHNNSTNNTHLPEIYFHYELPESKVDNFGWSCSKPRFERGNVHKVLKGVFEVSMSVRDGALVCNVRYDAHIKNQKSIQTWIEEIKSFLIQLANDLPDDSQVFDDPAEFPLLDFSKNDLSELQTQLSQRLGAPASLLIEDMYPCSPMQEEMLLSQASDPVNFSLKHAIELDVGEGRINNIDKLIQAWQVVVKRHSVLRTFFHLPSNQNKPLQIVLRDVEAPINIVESWDAAFLTDIPEISLAIPPHQVSIYKRSTRSVVFVLKISHAIIDGWSLSILKRDLLDECLSRLPHERPVTSYKKFIEHISSDPVQKDTEYWMKALASSEVCVVKSKHIPKRTKEPLISSFEVQAVPKDVYTRFCQDHGVTLASIIDTAWALTLHAFTGCRTPVFGYLTLGRDVDVPGINEMMGMTLNMLVNQVTVEPEVTKNLDNKVLSNLSKKLQDMRLSGMAHSRCNISALRKRLAPGAATFFNTAVNLQMAQWLDTKEVATNSPTLNSIAVEDPWNVDIMLRVWIHGEMVHSRLEFRSKEISAEDRETITGHFQHFLEFFK